MSIIILFLLLRETTALIGFDCGGQHLNVTSISLLEAGDCNLNIKSTNTTDTYIQLLQLSDYNYAEVIQCKVEIVRSIFYCGMHSHISIVHNGQAEYLEEISSAKCNRMHQDGTLSIGTASYIDGLRPNRTTTRGITLAGTVGVDGKCKGTQYSDPYGTWDDVVVQAIAKITLKSSYVPVHLTTGKIMLRSGTSCLLSEGYCIDPDNGHTFWKPMPTSSCDFHQYDVLYEGSATKIRDENLGQPTPSVYSLVTKDITFALTTTNQQQVCGYSLLRTEHPKLFILETKKGETPKTKKAIPVDNLDIFTYVNSKFVYVEKHVRRQMTSLYHDVIQQRCELEKEVIKNTLSLAKILPDEFAYRLMKGPGYMAVTAGEAVHVVKCIPVDAIVRKTKECYSELPVTVSNNSMFITAKSRILTKYGTQRECSHELPTLYLIEDTWIQLAPEPQVRSVPPQQLQPMAKISWTYLTPGALATSGIYSKQDLDKLRDHIMFPAEKPALLNSIARGITGYSTGANTASMYDLLNEDALRKIADNTAHRIWAGFITFGSATAGIFGIFVVIRVTKLIIDTAIHGYALHMAYGCSLHLLGALWSSLTHLLLHLAHGPPKRNKDKPDNKQSPPPNCSSTAPPEVVIDQPSSNHLVETTREQAGTPPSASYKDLINRLNYLEQIPPIASGVCSK